MYFASLLIISSIHSVYWFIVWEQSIHNLFLSLFVVFLTTTTWILYGDEVGSIMSWCNSCSTSLPIKFLSSFPNRRDFSAISLQLGGKFGKSECVSTEAIERLQIGPGLGPAYPVCRDICWLWKSCQIITSLHKFFKTLKLTDLWRELFISKSTTQKRQVKVFIVVRANEISFMKYTSTFRFAHLRIMAYSCTSVAGEFFSLTYIPFG